MADNAVAVAMNSVEVNASFRWKLILVGIHALATLAVALTPFNVLATGALLVVLLLSLSIHLRTGTFEPLTLDLRQRSSGVGAGSTALLGLTPATRVWGPSILLCVADRVKHRNYVLLADSVQGIEEWTRLRRHVRWLKSAQ